MKLTAEHAKLINDAIATVPRDWPELKRALAHRDAIFLAGCAWQRERDAKICERIATQQRNDIELERTYANGLRDGAAAIRAQGDDRG